MGSSQSKEQEEQLMETPWRTIKGWDKSTRDEMKFKLEELDPRKFGVPTFNIILTGDVGSGRSSFFNSVNSIFSEMFCTAKATAGGMSTIVTKEFRMYELKNTHIRIGDTRGIDICPGDADVRNLLKVVDGHVPNGHKFDLNEEFLPSCPGYIPSPKLAERAHCVALVVNADYLPAMRSEILRKLRMLAGAVIDRDLPIVIILTHLDKFLPKAKEDITKTFHREPLTKLVERVTNTFLGLPENQVFPVINYRYEVEHDSAMDVLLLYGLSCLTASAQSYLEKQHITAVTTLPAQLKYSKQEEIGPMELKKPSEKTPTQQDESSMEL